MLSTKPNTFCALGVCLLVLPHRTHVKHALHTLCSVNAVNGMVMLMRKHNPHTLKPLWSIISHGFSTAQVGFRSSGSVTVCVFQTDADPEVCKRMCRANQSEPVLSLVSYYQMVRKAQYTHFLSFSLTHTVPYYNMCEYLPLTSVTTFKEWTKKRLNSGLFSPLRIILLLLLRIILFLSLWRHWVSTEHSNKPA